MPSALMSYNESFIGLMVLVGLLIFNLIIRIENFYFGTTKVCSYVLTWAIHCIDYFCNVICGGESYSDVTNDVEPSHMMDPELDQPPHDRTLPTGILTSRYCSQMMASLPREPLNYEISTTGTPIPVSI